MNIKRVGTLTNFNGTHSCEDFDGECYSMKGYHGNDHDWTMEDYARGRSLPWTDVQDGDY